MSDDYKDIKIYDGKTLEDLFKDIYTNSKSKNKKITVIIDTFNKIITDSDNSINTALMLGPIIREFYDSSIKNDDQLVKMASVIQRLNSKTKTEDDGPLTQREIEDLMEEIDAGTNGNVESVVEKKLSTIVVESDRVTN
jgi:hypothetical protein